MSRFKLYMLPRDMEEWLAAVRRETDKSLAARRAPAKRRRRARENRKRAALRGAR